MHIPFVDLSKQHAHIKKDMLAAVEQLLDTHSFILGQELDEFEKSFSQYCQTSHAIGVSNGTDALKLSLQAAGIGNNDEVILPANTFHATALAVMQVGAKPILVEPQPESYIITAHETQKHITENTKAILPVHLYGYPCDMAAMMDLANTKQLLVIEDNAQAIGSHIDGKPTGSFGHINATSFYPTKNLGAIGDAGAITTNDEDLFKQVRLLRNFGSEKKYEHEILANNARMDSIQAAILSLKLPYVDAWNDERITIADKYCKRLHNVGDIILPNKPPYGKHVFHLFVIRTEKREDLQNFLKHKNIQTLIHYPVPIHLQPAFKPMGYTRGDFPVTEKISETILSLPLYIGMTDNQIDYVCENIIEFYAR